jgi:hypothetical protein
MFALAIATISFQQLSISFSISQKAIKFMLVNLLYQVSNLILHLSPDQTHSKPQKRLFISDPYTYSLQTTLF